MEKSLQFKPLIFGSRPFKDTSRAGGILRRHSATILQLFYNLFSSLSTVVFSCKLIFTDANVYIFITVLKRIVNIKKVFLLNFVKAL